MNESGPVTPCNPEAIIRSMIEAGRAPTDVEQRANRLENFRVESGAVTFDLVRHPPLLHSAFEADSSVACYFIRHTYRVSHDGTSISLHSELCEGLDIDGATVADWDVRRSLGALWRADDVRHFDSEADLRQWVKGESLCIVTATAETQFEPEESHWTPGLREHWRKFNAEFLSAWGGVFEDQVVEQWRERCG